MMSEGLPIAAQLEWTLADQTPSHPEKIVAPIPLISPISTVNLPPCKFPTSESGLTGSHGLGPEREANNDSEKQHAPKLAAKFASRRKSHGILI
jgi:hypothetical protein